MHFWLALGYMQKRLPLLTEVTLNETRACKGSLGHAYQQQVLSRTSVSCRIGCTQCCYHPIYISLLEGLLIHRSLVQSGTWFKVKPKLQEASKKTWGLATEIWALSNLPCPLLDENKCLAYKDRPFSCSVTYSIGDPEDCHPNRFSEGFLPKAAILGLFTISEKELLDKHSVTHFRLPLAAAVLYGERLEQGTLTIEDSLSALLKEPTHG